MNRVPAEPRLILDVSSVARWAGPPVGIIRVQQELAFAALKDRPDIELAVFDPARGVYRKLAAEWRDRILGADAALVVQAKSRRTGWRAMVPSAGRIMLQLERHRLLATSPTVAAAIDRLERMAALLPHDNFRLTTADGRRFDYVPSELALAGPIAFARNDTVITTGYNWIDLSPATIARLKRETGINYVVTCYDIIPIRYPEFYATDEAAAFRAYWRAMLPVADRVLAISHYTLADLRNWAIEEGLVMPPADVVRLGSMTGAGSAARDALPDGLKPGQYLLMVGTIEPRKGHELLINVWRDLLRGGVPQRHDFTLVFAGRYGWKMEHIKSEVAELSAGGRLLHLINVSDGQLATLYRNAAFCVLPSVTEGFGLPIIEAFSHGKAMIVSTGGALPEVAGEYAPCLDPADTASWREMIGNWIAHGSLRQAYEQRIKLSFRQPEWREVANDFWNAAARPALQVHCNTRAAISQYPESSP